MNKYLQGTIISELGKYPGLNMEVTNGEVTVEGNFKVMDPTNLFEIDNFNIKIGFQGYPGILPTVWETGGKIPPTMDRHVRPISKTLCFGSPQDQFEVSFGGVLFGYFVEHILKPHLAREYYREQKGYYPDGERSHNAEGLWEPYYEIFKTNEKNYILSVIELIITNPKYSRNALCYCNSGKTFKACHEKIANRILKAGVRNVTLLYTELRHSKNQ